MRDFEFSERIVGHRFFDGRFALDLLDALARKVGGNFTQNSLFTLVANLVLEGPRNERTGTVLKGKRLAISSS